MQIQLSMKIRGLTILLLFSWMMTFAQNQPKRTDTLKKIQLGDTIKLKKTDTIYIPKEELVDKELRVVLEETSKPNHFKDILPILTLLLGIGINKLLDFFKDRKHIRKTGERWKAELASLEAPLTNQVEYLEEFLIEHNKEVFQIPRLKVVTPLDCEAFSSLDKAELIKFIQSSLSKDYKESILLSSKITAFITIVKSNNESLRLKFDDYLQGTSKHTSELTSGLQELLKEMANLGVLIEKEVKGDPIQHPQYEALVNLFDKEITPKLETGDYDIYQLEKEFFLPLGYILAEMRLDDRTKKMADIASTCMSSIKGIKMEKKYLTENINTLTSHYKEDAQSLKAILQEFK